ncbi:MAG: phospholipid scramblase-related protein [Acidimicrobiia bacterium]
MTDTQHPAAWHPDPSKRHQQRYWDGEQWTEHVSDNGQTSVDEHGQNLANTGQAESTGIIDGEMFGYTTPEQVQAQVAKAQTSSGGDSVYSSMQMPEPSATDVPAPEYDKSIFTENILVVNQKAKLLELTAEYGVFDQSGNQLGAVREVGQSAAKKVARAFLNVDSLMNHTLDIVDMSGNLQLRITKPRRIVGMSKVVVENFAGQVIGEIQHKFKFGKMEMRLMYGETQIGAVHAENFRAWNFKILDAQNVQVASITKTWEGFAKAMFTTADNYVVQIHQVMADPLKSLVLASSLAVDLILKQNDKGLL